MGQLPAGSLNRRVIVQVKTTARDAAGQRIDVWTDYIKLWANFKTISGSAFSQQERISADVEVAPVTTSIRVRFRTDLSTDMRIYYEGKVYDIKALLPDEATREYLDIAVTQGESEG